MEAYYQNFRTYAANGNASPPCLTAQTVGKFTTQCAAPGAAAVWQGAQNFPNVLFAAVASGCSAPLASVNGESAMIQAVIACLPASSSGA